MTRSDLIVKRTFDIVLSMIGLLLVWPLILITALMASKDTGASGIFVQDRVGKRAKVFKAYKIRTMRPVTGTTVTTADDVRITELGAKLRRWKLDELPQLWNVLKGDMSFVGPRPDVPGFMDRLQGDDRAILALRPGITGPATLKYRNEEELLAKVSDPETYNATVIWPDKVKINLQYQRDWSFIGDLRYIKQTVIG